LVFRLAHFRLLNESRSFVLTAAAAAEGLSVSSYRLQISLAYLCKALYRTVQYQSDTHDIASALLNHTHRYL